MKIWSGVKFVLMMFMCLLPLTACASVEERVTRRGMHSAMSVDVSNNGMWRIAGSAVLVEVNDSFGVGTRMRVLTAKHVAEAVDRWGYQMRACWVKEPDNCVYLDDHIASSESGYGSDWAIFEINHEPDGMRPAYIRYTRSRLGEKVVIIGHPWGEFMVSSGIMSAYRMDWNGNYYYVAHAYAAPGNSGGPVYDSRARLIGLLVARDIKPNVITGLPEMQEDAVWITPIQNIGY